MFSTKQKLTQLQGLVGTKDLTQWETTFVENMARLCSTKAGTTVLSSSQVEKLDEVYEAKCK